MKPAMMPPRKPEPVDVGSIALDPGARVNGLVSAPDGSPIEGVEVGIVKTAAGPMMMGGRGGPATPPAAVTGADDRFALDDLEPGKPVNLSFSRAGWVRKSESGVEPPRTEPLLVSLCVDEDIPPYAYVRVDGTTSLLDDPELLRTWAARIGGRYMGAERAAEYGARNGVEGELLVRITPTRIVAQAGIAD